MLADIRYAADRAFGAALSCRESCEATLLADHEGIGDAMCEGSWEKWRRRWPAPGVAVLQGCHRPAAGSSLHTFDAAGQSVFANTGFAMHDLLRRVDEVLRPAGEDCPIFLEFASDGARRAEIRYIFDLPTVALVRLMLDPDYSTLNHPASPMPTPPGVAVTDRCTDTMSSPPSAPSSRSS